MTHLGRPLSYVTFCFLSISVVSAVPLRMATGHATPGPATIIDLTNGCDPQHPGAERATLSGLLTAAGDTVTEVTTGVVPGSLSGQVQVWDIRCQTALSPAEVTTYTNYLTGGGSLFLMGENTGYAPQRDASLLSFIQGLGGGTLTLTSTNNSQTAQPPFTGPTSLSTVTFRAIGGTTTPGNGAFGTIDSNDFGGVLAFGPTSLSGAPAGTLIIVFDVNFLDNASNHTASETTLTNNLIAYLAAPTPIVGGSTPSTVSTPALSPVAVLALALMLGLTALVTLRRRTA